MSAAPRRCGPCSTSTTVDQLLQKLRTVHGEARFDLAPELVAATRTAGLHKL
jgi:hypothetical protein